MLQPESATVHVGHRECRHGTLGAGGLSLPHLGVCVLCAVEVYPLLRPRTLLHCHAAVPARAGVPRALTHTRRRRDRPALLLQT